MSERNKSLLGWAACAAGTSLLVFMGPAQANDAGAFIGGMVTMKVVNNMERRTQAEEAQAYRPAPQPVPQAAPAAPARPSKETQLQDLDRLAAGGYITPQEYRDRRKAILDSM